MDKAGLTVASFGEGGRSKPVAAAAWGLSILQESPTSTHGSVIWEGFQSKASFLEGPYNPCSL